MLAFVPVLLILLASPVLGVTPEIGTASLLEEMTGLPRLSRLPVPAYTTRQFSSYNRASTVASDPIGWFANQDRGYYLRTEQNGERTEHVMMDAEGPGALVRIWSASRQGTLRIYIDGDGEPAIESPLTTLLGGEYPGLPAPLAGCRARGWNLYFPIAFARHCKVTTDTEGLFYHIGWRSYPPETRVRSFARKDLDTLADRISRAARQLASAGKGGESAPDAVLTPFAAEVLPGQREVLLDLEGPAAISRLSVVMRASDRRAAAAGAVVGMYFDGERTVSCPLCYFFNTDPDLTPYESLPMGVSDGEQPEMWSRWWMPFRRRAKLVLHNLSSEEVRLEGSAHTAAHAWDDRSLLFHAGWRIERDIPTRPFTDWTHLQCGGQGRFVGGGLHVINPVRKWWGEGDEKIFVDDEVFPSHFGTGSEDYYGYAWCSPQRFGHAFHSQIRCDGPGNYGHTYVSRFHIIDDIPFARGFRFDMENWHHNPITRTTRAAVSYWYARPGGRDSFQELTADQLRPLDVPEYAIPQVSGAIEAESMQVLGPAAGAEPMDADERFSAGRQLIWRGARTGGLLTLIFDAEETARRRVLIRPTLGRHAPVARFRVNDGTPGFEVDLSHHRTTPCDQELDLGVHPLSRHGNRLVIEFIGPGRHAVSRDSYEFGLDYLRLVPP